MTYKQIESLREARLWIGQVIVPGATLAASMMAIPEVRQAVKCKAQEIRQSIQKKISRMKKES